MKISQSEFDQLLAENKLRISLMGMSNIGKTAWSKKLRKTKNFKHICCDDLIEAKIEPELTSMGYKGIHDMAKWLGQPYDERFVQNQSRYLDLEIGVMNEILSSMDRVEENLAIDTTGSVIYTGDEICSELKERSLLVYIEATENMKEAMFENFIKNPKPIVWGQSFNQQDEESDKEALARCYPELLNYRSKLYEKYADIVIPYFDVDVFSKSADDFLNIVKSYL